jgi:hypothetical protein
LQETSQKTTGVGIAMQLVKKRAVGNQVINGIADKASASGTSRTSIESGNQEVIIIKVGGGGSRKGVNRNRAARKVTWGGFQDIRATSILSKAGEFRENMIRVKVEREWSAEWEGTKSKIEARLKDRTNGGIKMPNELVEKEAI